MTNPFASSSKNKLIDSTKWVDRQILIIIFLSITVFINNLIEMFLYKVNKQDYIFNTLNNKCFFFTVINTLKRMLEEFYI